MVAMLAFSIGAVILGYMSATVRAGRHTTICGFPARWVSRVVRPCEISVLCGIILGNGALFLMSWPDLYSMVRPIVPLSVLMVGILALWFGSLYGAVLFSMEMVASRTKPTIKDHRPAGDYPLWDSELDL